jgi:hypothetical protein
MGTAADDPVAQQPLIEFARPADILDMVQAIDEGLALRAAAFQQDHLRPARPEFSRDRRAGGPAANDADVAAEVGPWR